VGNPPERTGPCEVSRAEAVKRASLIVSFDSKRHVELRRGSRAKVVFPLPGTPATDHDAVNAHPTSVAQR